MKKNGVKFVFVDNINPSFRVYCGKMEVGSIHSSFFSDRVIFTPNNEGYSYEQRTLSLLSEKCIELKLIIKHKKKHGKRK